jgi:hypothetical protein
MNVPDKNLFLVLRPEQNPHQTYFNKWLDGGRIESITTTVEIANLCHEEKRKNKTILIHRCGCENLSPVICCSASVIQIDQIDANLCRVIFGEQQSLDLQPPIPPLPGQSFYFA